MELLFSYSHNFKYFSISAIDVELSTKETILSKLCAKLLKAQQAMKHYIDAKRLLAPFQLGDLVMVRLQPYRQVLVTGTKVQKLVKCYCGSFPIVQCFDNTTYALALPAGFKMHLVFHTSLLKSLHGSDNFNSMALPPKSFENQPCIQPMAILDYNGEGELMQQKMLFGRFLLMSLLYLEDKVFVKGEWDDMKKKNLVKRIKELEKLKQMRSNKIWIKHPKSIKHISHKPKWMRDYVVS
ncbi:hypothetical protein CR513_52687, partial [Mucuna pruriens]